MNRVTTNVKYNVLTTSKIFNKHRIAVNIINQTLNQS